jgi:AcrR family transcriptional regulator
MVKDGQKPDKRITILEATLTLIATQGFHNTPTSQIAETARVGVGSIYRYFKDKDELIHELFRYVIAKGGQSLLKDYNPAAPVRQQFMQLCTGIIQYSVEHPKEFTFIEQYFHSPYGLSHRREMMFGEGEKGADKPPLHRLFETAKTQQIVKDLPLVVLGALSVGPIIALLRDIHAGLFEYDAEIMCHVVEACWDAIKR